MTLSFRVIGTPAPQGSKKHVGHGVMVESSKAVKPWRQAVATAAAEAREKAGVAPFDGPVVLSVLFILPAPQRASKRLQGPCRNPDIDKLLRSTMDAMSDAMVWVDDARVVRVSAAKAYPVNGEALGAHVEVRGL